jgi:hypothetical protein
MLNGFVRFFTSLRLTVVLLALGLVLVFLGTLAQEPLGLYVAQDRFFRSFFVDASCLYAALYKMADMLLQGFGYPLPPLNAHQLLTRPRIPAFPGGYLVGGVLLINLLAAHTRYYRPEKRKIGIAMIHLGVVLLLVGQLLTDLLSTESSMHIRQGSSANYSEAGRSFELAVIDATDADSDKTVAIPEHRLLKHRDIAHPELPFTVRVKTFYGNSSLSRERGEGFEQVKTTAGGGAELWWRQLPLETEMNRRDMPSGLIELVTPKGSLGTYLISAFLSRPQEFTHAGRRYQLVLRPERFYKPFSLHLVEFKFDRYPGTEIPKNFSSRVRVQRPDTGEDREVLIFMNNPLRYGGETFYQADWDKEDEKGTILQVVRNPGWLTPYFACVLVALGMVIQFFTHLIGFATKRRTT